MSGDHEPPGSVQFSFSLCSSKVRVGNGLGFPRRVARKQVTSSFNASISRRVVGLR